MSDTTSEATPDAYIDGYPNPPHRITAVEAAQALIDISTELYDALERLHRETTWGLVSYEAMSHAEDVLCRARGETK